MASTSKDIDNVHKRDREGDSFIAETIEDIKFKTPYSKRSKSTEEEKDKAVNIDINDEATIIVTQTLKELQNVKIGTQQKDTVMKENQATVDLPPSSHETDNTESEIQIRFRQIKEKN